MAEERPPVPDPTILTTQQLQREISTSREIIEAQIMGLRDLLQAQFHGTDAKINAIQERLLVSVRDRKEDIEHLRNLQDEKFSSIANQFVERDKRTEQLSLADKTAVAAALQAQKEAAGAQNEANAASFSKSEAAFTKMIEQTQLILNTVTKSMDQKIDDLKTRMDKGEGHGRGSADMWGWILGAVGVVLSIATLIVLAFRIGGHP